MLDVSNGVLKKKLSVWAIVTIVLVIVLIIVAGVFGYLYFQESNKVRQITASAQNKPSNVAELEEANKIIEDLGKIILIAETEQPTVATITDVEKLKSNNGEFYANAENGDRLILYPKRAIIYREKDRKIINITPIVVQPKKYVPTDDVSE